MAFATIGNRLTYTIVVENTGTLPANNIMFTDPIPTGTTFVTNSVTVNGVPTPGNPANGIPIPTIPPGSSTTITFEVDVTSIPSPPVTSNQGEFQYEFQPAPNAPNITRTTNTNIVNTDLFNANVALTKDVDRDFATIDDVITYTITATNQESLPANNVIITDVIPTGTTFIPESVTINSVASTDNPTTGITVDTIPANDTAIITFQVQVTNIPNPNPIQNVATSTFEYNPPDQPAVNRNSTSNFAQTTINSAIVNPQKVVSQQTASIGDIITYTITIPNNGNIPATNVTVTDPIPAGATFIPNSILVNGISVPNATPDNISIGTIAPRQSTTVSFQVQVTSIPPNGIVTNEANITFTSQPDPNQPPTTTTTTTPPTATAVSTAIINPVKTSNRQSVGIGDIITYTITTQNTGNIPATNVIVTDPIPAGTTFFPNSVTINDAQQPGVNPIGGIQVGTLEPGQSTIVSFQVQVTSIPPDGVIENSGNTTFTFHPNPNHPPITTTNPTPPVTVPVNTAIVNPIKSANRTIVDLDDTITYTITFENTGNVPATNVSITDPIPDGTTFIPNSVLVNNSPVQNVNPADGIPVGIVNVGETVTVSFLVLVNSIPSDGTITNQGSATFTYQPEPEQPPITVTETTAPTHVSVRNGTVVSTKNADRSSANIGDVITYTIVLQNTGNTPATDVSLTDPIPSGTTFIPNSVIVNGTPQPGTNPADGLSLGTVNPNQPTTVTFQVQITSIPPNGNIVNQGSVTSTYTVEPNQPPVTTTTPTPTTTTPIETAIITPMKTADQTTIDVGDTVTYTISFTNVGTVPATNTVLTDPTPAGTAFVPNSVTINGDPTPGANPDNGISVGILTPGQSVTITYQVTVTSLPPDGIIRNQATFNYQYQPDPNQPPITATNPTPTVEVTVANPNPTTTKTADQQYVDIGDTITFTMTFLNKGTVAATDVLAQDTLPVGVSFVPGSVTVNGTPQPGANPELDINVGTVLPNQTVTVLFQGIVQSAPPGGIIQNKGSFTFTYQPNPNEPPITITTPTPETTTTVNTATLNPQKTSNVSSADLNDIITYTLSFQNTGTVPATNVVITDPIPAGTTFIPNSISVNGTAQVGANLESGISIGTLAPSQTATITFQVQVTNIPPNGQIINQGTATFNYIVNPNQTPITVTETTPQTVTPVQSVIIAPTKTTNMTFVQPNDIVTYTISFTNQGTIPATNVIITDILPAGTTFIPNSATVNGTPQPNINLETGIPVDTVNPGDTIIVTFQISVDTIPPNGTISNTANVTYTSQSTPTQPPVTTTTTTQPAVITVQIANPDPIKTVDKVFAQIGDILTYTITLNNIGNLPATNINITDIIPLETVFMPSSITINGVPQPGAIPNNPISIGTLNPSEKVVVTLQVIVIVPPANGVITNSATITYTSQPNPTQPPITTTTTTPPAKTKIVAVNVRPTKTASNQVVTTGDVLTYSISVPNNSAIPITNVIVTDTIPPDTSFVPNSVTINGVPQPSLNPANGVSIDMIYPNQTATITFQTTVVSVPPGGLIINQATVTFTYELGPGIPPVTANIPTTPTNTAVFEINVQPNKTADRQSVTIGDIITYSISVPNKSSIPITNVIVTDPIPPGTSFVPNSVTINGVPQPNLNPASGITIDTVVPNQTDTITFQTIVVSIPSSGIITNKATVTFTYEPEPGVPPVITNIPTPTIDTTLFEINVQPNKTADRQSARIGDIITYSISVPNNSSIPITNVIVTDPIPAGTSFVPNSVTINGVPQPNLNPANGVTIDRIYPKQTGTITLQLTVVSVPPGGMMTNQATVTFTYEPGPQIAPVIIDIPTPPADTVLFDINVQPTKTASSQVVTTGDIITYSISVPNNSSIPITNVIVTDPIPPGTSFVPNSVTINGVPQPHLNPVNGVAIGTIDPNQTSTITLQLTVVSVPPSRMITNQATVSFTYEPGPNIPPVTEDIPTPTTDTAVFEINVQPSKTADRQSVTIGDIITYSISVPNNGSIPITNVIVTDPIPLGTSFVPNSVIINGVPQPNLNPANGVAIGTIDPNQTGTISFQTTVVSAPPGGMMTNQATVTFTYEPGFGLPPVTEDIPTPTTNTTVFEINIQPIKTADRQSVTIGDIITYSISVPNNSSIPITNVIVTDPIPPGSSFVTNSVIINGVPQPNLNPASGVTIGTINPNQTSTISFQTTVVSVPPGGMMTNQATVTFTYEPGPGIPPVTDNIPTPTTNTTVFEIDIQPIKTADRQSATIGDIITYSISVPNNSSIPTTNVIVTDPIPAGTSFVPNSVTVNGVPQPHLNPATGVTIDSINPNQTGTISFQTTIVSVPPSGMMTNQATVTYTYEPEPGISPVITDTTTPPIDTTVFEINVQPHKTADRQSIKIGDIITYSISVPNNSSIPITNVIVTDPIPPGTTFVPNSVTVNGVPQPHLNPATGVTIDSINPNQTGTISFQTTIVSVPPSGLITNQATVRFTYQPGTGIPPATSTTTTPPVTASIDPPNTIVKTANVSKAPLNDFITYTITFTNNGATPARNILITDPLPPEVTFYSNSVLVNGVSRPGSNPIRGILIETVNPGESVIVQFIVQVIARPQNGFIQNNAHIRYTVRPDPTKPPIFVDETSKPNIIPVIGPVPVINPFVSPNLNCFFNGERFIRRGGDRKC